MILKLRLGVKDIIINCKNKKYYIKYNKKYILHLIILFDLFYNI